PSKARASSVAADTRSIVIRSPLLVTCSASYPAVYPAVHRCSALAHRTSDRRAGANQRCRLRIPSAPQRVHCVRLRGYVLITKEPAMHDIVIRGGTIVDGTGRSAFAGDVAIDGERLAAVGGKAGPGRRVIDAAGLLVTPGWVDVHTHYDGQATWDPILAPSSWQGVPTIIFGNCGVGFAPVRPYHHDGLLDLLEGVEDIRGTALAEGLEW